MPHFFVSVRNCLAVGVALVLSSAVSADEQVFLVQDGRPLAEIVVAEKPARMVTLAASELQSYVEKISGAKLTIVTKPSGGELIPIFIGKSPQTGAMKVNDAGLEHGAFRLIVRDSAVVLLGRDAGFTPPEPHARHNGDIAAGDGRMGQAHEGELGLPAHAGL